MESNRHAKAQTSDLMDVDGNGFCMTLQLKFILATSQTINPDHPMP